LASAVGTDHAVDLDESPLVQALSQDYGVHPYGKWRGAFWRLAALVELGVDGSHEGARRALEESLSWLDSPSHRTRPTIAGRVRRCATQEGIGLAAAVALGRTDDDRVARLAGTLVTSQWPDGGWNCDRRPEASHSSFHESWAPIRGLAAYARETGDAAADEAARRGADFLLRHRVYCSERTGEPHEALARLRFPPYWHYDALVGLTTLARSVGLDDDRAGPALDLLESKRRADGTWRVEGRWWKRPGSKGSNVEAVDWTSTADELLTIGCLAVLSAAGR
jgi:hypothetical protein